MSTQHAFLIRSFFLASIIVFCVGAQSCGSFHAPPEYRRIFDLPAREQEREYKKLPLDKQVDMYRYAVSQEPPDTKYTYFLASNGKEVIPYLLERISEEESEYIKASLICVFQYMHREYYNLRNENEVIERLKLESSNIKHIEFKEDSDKCLKAILEEPGIRK